VKKTETIICDVCGFVGPSRIPRKRGSALLERLIWIAFLFPGIFYSYWRRTDRSPECPKCGARALTPFDTEEGQAMFRRNLEKTRKE
jgi:hypothetical protein